MTSSSPTFSPSFTPTSSPTFSSPTFSPTNTPTHAPTYSQAQKTNFFSTITYPINFNQVGFNPVYGPLPEYEFGLNGKSLYDYSKFHPGVYIEIGCKKAILTTTGLHTN